MIEELVAPPNRALCRYQDVAQELGLADPTELKPIVLQVSDTFEQGLNRSFPKTAVRETFELASQRPVSQVLLTRTPVETIASVTGPDGEVIPAKEYALVDKDLGLLRFERTQVATGFDSVIVVEYTGGYVLPDWPGQTSTLPPSIERACIEASKALYEVRGGGSDVSTERLGDYSATYRSPGSVIEAHLASVARFRRVSVF